MGVKIKPPPAAEKINIDMTPMIDVVFQLLIFFMLTLKIKADEGDFSINMPLGETQMSEPSIPDLKVRMATKSRADGGSDLLEPDGKGSWKMVDEIPFADSLTTFPGGYTSDGKTLYAHYTFSYRSTLPEAKGARVMFEGVAMMKLRDGKILEYHEVANTAPAFVDMNFAPERIAKIFAKQGAALKGRPEMRRHLA